ncbi:unnamed protein product [Fusarium graminearum]|uniref:Chromosome 1, complete genome n=1 Tax=Gibberella zeae (strain ATCC MYA-4620 / CBS 123657 / FGSC 9075 / NRRL 31084 / PH-1) TaxID=229533 RepID=I1S5M4_GIBZE|nr:hypothetical protein FGSG_12145 [Fusarium graminearum PH-1]ESU07913.1 hypothetical protein FGSG_12145 [Fusarium graminearum PH-1]CEF74770.1 unnamed protein product [Fusarium graminearum]CZS78049.1 unnamed protein product [Fusarium graminearum]|eukprot:XP_011318398.1 hypothetical protein FGSG_12145 [Fusarium graminearum PH-1]
MADPSRSQKERPVAQDSRIVGPGPGPGSGSGFEKEAKTYQIITITAIDTVDYPKSPLVDHNKDIRLGSRAGHQPATLVIRQPCRPIGSFTDTSTQFFRGAAL